MQNWKEKENKPKKKTKNKIHSVKLWARIASESKRVRKRENLLMVQCAGLALRVYMYFCCCCFE